MAKTGIVATIGSGEPVVALRCVRHALTPRAVSERARVAGQRSSPGRIHPSCEHRARASAATASASFYSPLLLSLLCWLLAVTVDRRAPTPPTRAGPTLTRCPSPRRRGLSLRARIPAGCTRAGTTGTSPCCWVRRGCSRRARTRCPAPCGCCSSRRRRAARAATSWSRRVRGLGAGACAFF